jgi:hypothetical protein
LFSAEEAEVSPGWGNAAVTIRFVMGQILDLLDYLLKLLERRESDTHEYFDRYIQPAYETSETVYKNVCEALLEIRRKIVGGASFDDLLLEFSIIRQHRQAERAKLRAIVQAYNLEHLDTLPRFEQGIIGILRGGLRSVEDRPLRC